MSAACGICDPCTCDDCNGTGECTFEDHTLPCPYCRPAAASKGTDSNSVAGSKAYRHRQTAGVSAGGKS